MTTMIFVRENVPLTTVFSLWCENILHFSATKSSKSKKKFHVDIFAKKEHLSEDDQCDWNVVRREVACVRFQHGGSFPLLS